MTNKTTNESFADAVDSVPEERQLNNAFLLLMGTSIGISGTHLWFQLGLPVLNLPIWVGIWFFLSNLIVGSLFVLFDTTDHLVSLLGENEDD